jgi:hypothetical protein
MAQSIYIVELADGRVLVLLEQFGGNYRPVAELAEGESYAGIPYDAWAMHVGETVDVAALEREQEIGASATAPVVGQSVDVGALRVRGQWMYGILAAFAGLCVVLPVIEEWHSHFWLYLVSPYPVLPVLVFLALHWARIAWRMYRNDIPVGPTVIAGWGDIVIGGLVMLLGAAWVSGAGALGVFAMGLGALIAEAGRTYLRVRSEQARVSSEPAAPPAS